MWRRRQEEEPTAEVQAVVQVVSSHPQPQPQQTEPDWGNRSAENFGTDPFLLGAGASPNQGQGQGQGQDQHQHQFNHSASNWEDNDSNNGNDHTDADDNDSTLNGLMESRHSGTLYGMAEKTYKMHQKHKSTMNEAVRKRRMERLWDGIRSWMDAAHTAEEQMDAATHEGQFQTTVLHLICQLPDPPADVVQLLIEAADPNAIHPPTTSNFGNRNIPHAVNICSLMDPNGWLPLHHACANGASGQVLQLLVQAYPEGRTVQDNRQRTPLHFCFFREDIRSRDQNDSNDPDSTSTVSVSASFASPDETLSQSTMGNVTSVRFFVNLLVQSGATQYPDENGMLPLHYACAYGCSKSVLEILLNAEPESCTTKDFKGRTALHLAMVNYFRDESPMIVEILLSRGFNMVNIRDEENNLPLNLLASVAKENKLHTGRNNAAECIKLYLDRQPQATGDFLLSVQSLPEWLRDHAVVHTHVQEILNIKIVKRFPTSILMIDIFMLLLTIICFELSTQEHIDYRFYGRDQDPVIPVNDDYNVFVGFSILGGSYFLVREFIQMLSLANMGLFNSWLLDVSNWLDGLMIGLVLYYGAAMLDGEMGNDDSFRLGVAITKGILWSAVISFLKSTLVDFAVFVGGVFYVVRRLAAFLLALGVILLAFAQMFLIIYKRTDICDLTVCMEQQLQVDEGSRDTLSRVCRIVLNQYVGTLETCDIDPFPHCTFTDSLLKVYTMLMGEVGDETRYDTEPVAQFLYVAFAFLVVILLSNVLIAIVTDSYGVIKNERAAMVFWSNRLDFVAEMDAISSYRRRLCNPNKINLGGEGDALTNSQGSGGTAGAGSAGGATEEDYDEDGMPKKRWEPVSDAWKNLFSLFESREELGVSFGELDFWLLMFFRLVAVFVLIPLWLAVGLATAGWLWPPQVRKFLFVQRKTKLSRAEMAKMVSKQIDELKDEVKGLRFELRGEVKTDRTDLMAMKTQIDAVQISVRNDMDSIREIMTTLLEMTREQAGRQ